MASRCAIPLKVPRPASSRGRVSLLRPFEVVKPIPQRVEAHESLAERDRADLAAFVGQKTQLVKLSQRVQQSETRNIFLHT